MSENRLLVLDDELAIAQLVADVAASCDYDVQITADPVVLRTRLDEWNPTHIVVDLQMPGMDGIEVIRYLAQEKSQAKIILISGFDARVLELARRLGKERGLDIAAALKKPLGVADLRTVLKSVRVGGGSPPTN